MKKDSYSMLSQNERDPEDFIIKPQKQSRRKSCFLGLFVVIAIIVMLGGAVALVAGLFYSNEVNGAINTYWATKLNDTISAEQGATHSIENTGSDSEAANLTTITTQPPFLNHTSSNETSSETTDDTDDYDDEEDAETDGGEVTEPNPTAESETKKPGKKSTPAPGHKEAGSTVTTLNETSSGDGLLAGLGLNGKVLSEAQEKFAQFALKIEKFMEDFTGVRRAELLIPLFMLVCFIVSLSLTSCCCYLMMKRRDNQRRRVLGKIITDLQTGDSKAVLLDQDGDD